MDIYRVWLDPWTANSGLTKENLEDIIANGMTIVVSSTAIDVTIFQQNLCWFEEMLYDDNIIIEMWETPDEMMKKPFYWSSCSTGTAAAEDLLSAIDDLPNSADILDVSDLVEFFGIPKDECPVQQCDTDPRSAEFVKQLNLDIATATRTDVFTAAKLANRMDDFAAYNISYIRSMAKQHSCHAIINSDGSITSL